MNYLIQVAWDWANRCFGAQMTDAPTRALRVLEEAAELAQSSGVPLESAGKCLGMVYSRERGTPHQEMGGVLMTAYLFCRLQGWAPEEVFASELRRVLKREAERPGTFAERNKEKVDLGLGDR